MHTQTKKNRDMECSGVKKHWRIRTQVASFTARDASTYAKMGRKSSKKVRYIAYNFPPVSVFRCFSVSLTVSPGGGVRKRAGKRSQRPRFADRALRAGRGISWEGDGAFSPVVTGFLLCENHLGTNGPHFEDKILFMTHEDRTSDPLYVALAVVLTD